MAEVTLKLHCKLKWWAKAYIYALTAYVWAWSHLLRGDREEIEKFIDSRTDRLSDAFFVITEAANA